MNKKLVNEIDDFLEAIAILAVPDFEGERYRSLPVSANYLGPLLVDSPMAREAVVISREQKAFQVFVDYRSCLNVGEKVLECEHPLAGVHSELQAPWGHPLKAKTGSSVFEIILREAAKYPPVGVCLETFSDYSEGILGHWFSQRIAEIQSLSVPGIG